MSYQQRGFTLVELMVSLLLGVIISGAIIQVLVSNQVTSRLNQAMASAQEGGRFIVQRLRDDVLRAGLYDRNSPLLNRDVDTLAEESFIHQRTINLPGDFIQRPLLGASQGADGAADTLVISMAGSSDCRSLQHGYNGTERFHVVNEYFLEDGQLKCRGFDGRALRGLKAAQGHDGNAAYTLLDDVVDFQVQYGIAFTNAAENELGRPAQYVTAEQLAALRGQGASVVTIRFAVLVKGDGQVNLPQAAQFKLLNEALQNAPDNGYYRDFGATVVLRNSKNWFGASQ